MTPPKAGQVWVHRNGERRRVKQVIPQGSSYHVFWVAPDNPTVPHRCFRTIWERWAKLAEISDE